jgi:hypothetical protein
MLKSFLTVYCLFLRNDTMTRHHSNYSTDAATLPDYGILFEIDVAMVAVFLIQALIAQCSSHDSGEQGPYTWEGRRCEQIWLRNQNCDGSYRYKGKYMELFFNNDRLNHHTPGLSLLPSPLHLQHHVLPVNHTSFAQLQTWQTNLSTIMNSIIGH